MPHQSLNLPFLKHSEQTDYLKGLSLNTSQSTVKRLLMGIVSQLIMVIKNLENPHTDYWKIQHEFEEKESWPATACFFSFKELFKKSYGPYYL